MKLKKRIAKDYKEIQKASNNLFAFASNEIGKEIAQANIDCMATIAAVLSSHPEKITFSDLAKNHTLDNLRDVLNKRYGNLAIELEEYWTIKRAQFDIISRLGSHFIAQKAAPPWVKSVINLQSELSTDGAFDPRKGHLRMYFRLMVDSIIQQISQGAVKEESMTAILKRVRKMFDRNNRAGVREARHPVKDFEEPIESINPETGDWSQTIYGPAEITEGTYTLEDVAQLRDDLKRANKWAYRDYRPWFTDEVKRNNKYFRMLDQMLRADAVDQLHSGFLKIGPESMGIDDMEWVASIGPTTCQHCRDRDGMTMREIKEVMKDEYKDDPPPLHPNCYCELAPSIKDSWADNILEKEGMSWDDETGITYNASQQEVDAGIQDMTFDQYLKSIPID